MLSFLLRGKTLGTTDCLAILSLIIIASFLIYLFRPLIIA